jgi:hypothetical protein
MTQHRSIEHVGDRLVDSKTTLAEILRVIILLCAFAAGALMLFGDNRPAIVLTVVIGGLLIFLGDAWKVPAPWHPRSRRDSRP